MQDQSIRSDNILFFNHMRGPSMHINDVQQGSWRRGKPLGRPRFLPISVRSPLTSYFVPGLSRKQSP